MDSLPSWEFRSCLVGKAFPWWAILPSHKWKSETVHKNKLGKNNHEFGMSSEGTSGDGKRWKADTKCWDLNSSKVNLSVFWNKKTEIQGRKAKTENLVMVNYVSELKKPLFFRERPAKTSNWQLSINPHPHDLQGNERISELSRTIRAKDNC